MISSLLDIFSIVPELVRSSEGLEVSSVGLGVDSCSDGLEDSGVSLALDLGETSVILSVLELNTVLSEMIIRVPLELVNDRVVPECPEWSLAVDLINVEPSSVNLGVETSSV